MPIKSEPEALHSIDELPRRADEEPSIPIEVAEDDPAAIERDRLAHRLLIAWAKVLDQE
ncbi:MAG TPA: hypothetical protein VKM72_09340 [Thermoanaerobaculia bacterium]|nr:hypothetical protein [Thermoanaerobaculia bacterium]